MFNTGLTILLIFGAFGGGIIFGSIGIVAIFSLDSKKEKTKNMIFNWDRKCIIRDCNHKIWDACFTNTNCIRHCGCPENKELKHNDYEIILATKLDSVWKILSRNRYSRNARKKNNDDIIL